MDILPFIRSLLAGKLKHGVRVTLLRFRFGGGNQKVVEQIIWKNEGKGDKK